MNHHKTLFLLLSACLLLPIAPVWGGPSDLLKSSAATKTKDDADGQHMGEYKGVKHAIGILDFENQGGFFSEFSLGSNLALMLESALFETGRFVIVERGDLGAVMAEQDLQASSRTATAAATAQTGSIRSARYLATGAITEASYNTSGDGGGIRIKGFRIGGSSDKASMVTIIKLIDTTTGEVVASERIRGEAGKSGINVGFYDSGLGGNFGTFARTPLAEAAQDCVNTAVAFIARSMADFEIEGAVVTVAGDRIIINLGETRGVTEGQTFLVRTDGEVLIDPSTGEVLDRLEGEVTATIKVNSVREKISYCELVDGVTPERGATVIFH